MTKTDKIIFWSVILSAILFLLFSNIIFAKKTGSGAIVIELNGKEYARYEQAALNQPKILEIKTEFGCNKVEISSRAVRISESDCRDQRCIGEICNIGEMVICLPNRLVVKIEGSRQEEVDGVAY